MRLTPEEMDLLEQGLGELAARRDAFTLKVQPAASGQAIGAVTRMQAIEMLRAILDDARLATPLAFPRDA